MTSFTCDRSALRVRPAGRPLMYQTWGKLLFLHWPVPAERLRPHIPDCLEIDTYGATAWIAITPLTIWAIRPSFLPPVPVLSSSHELNVRTYVHRDGVPGVWFFSLDAANPLAVWGARLGFALPYFQAIMRLGEQDRTIRYRSRRTHPGSPAAEFRATWTRGDRLPELQPDTLDFFLIERYCLYTVRKQQLYCGRIFHDPWRLCRATLSELESTMLSLQGLPSPAGEPLLHAQAEPLTVGIWRLERL